MNRDNARIQIKSYLQEYIEEVTQRSEKGGSMNSPVYICPLCGSGTKENKTGGLSIYSGNDGLRWKCFSCGLEGDIFELFGRINGIMDFNQQLMGLCEIYGVSIDSSGGNFNYDRNKSESVQNVQVNRNCEVEKDYSDFFLQAHTHIKETDYPQKRGLSEEVVNKFNLGYIAEWRHPKAPEKVPTTPRLIIPTSNNTYLARDIRPDGEIPENQKQYTKMKVGGVQIFNSKALREAKTPIFVVEGEMDALSIVEVGGEAVALGSISKTRDFVELCKESKPSQTLVIALDNDEAGERAAREIMEELKVINVLCCKFNPVGLYKDANEALQDDREAFRRDVESVNVKYMQEERKERQEEQEQVGKEEKEARESYLRTSAANYLKSFIDGIDDDVNTPCIPTGFENLDVVLDGGLFEGVYIIGAVSSLGKTTLVNQIADNVAKSGEDVLMFSLEMARSEIMAKSISKHTLERVLSSGEGGETAKTARDLTVREKYQNYSEKEKEIINLAIEDYSKYAGHIYISEGVGDIGAKQVRDIVKQHIFYTGKKPVVIIDYLQILAPYNVASTDKQNTDKAVLELKRISRDYKIPVICISSFNRASYSESVHMSAFKESGAIEYSSDVLIGLQFKGAGEKNFDVSEAKKKNPREIEIVILKNRNGRVGDKLEFEFYPNFNYFEEKKKKKSN